MLGAARGRFVDISQTSKPLTNAVQGCVPARRVQQHGGLLFLTINIFFENWLIPTQTNVIFSLLLPWPDWWDFSSLVQVRTEQYREALRKDKRMMDATRNPEEEQEAYLAFEQVEMPDTTANLCVFFLISS